MGVYSLPQYLVAISMPHHVAGYLDFLAFDKVIRLLTRAWRRRCPEPANSHAPVPAGLMRRLLEVGL